MCSEPTEFLKAAKEIDELRTLKRKFRKHSDLTMAELAKNIYDGESKARLLTLLIALVSVTVALTVKSEATLDMVFNAYFDPGFRRALKMFAALALTLFLTLVGLRQMVLAAIDVVASWWAKLFGESVFADWLLSYLARDLVLYHNAIASTSFIEQVPHEPPTDYAPAHSSNVLPLRTGNHLGRSEFESVISRSNSA